LLESLVDDHVGKWLHVFIRQGQKLVGLNTFSKSFLWYFG